MTKDEQAVCATPQSLLFKLLLSHKNILVVVAVIKNSCPPKLHLGSSVAAAVSSKHRAIFLSKSYLK